jgi:hypothetical protein
VLIVVGLAIATSSFASYLTARWQREYDERNPRPPSPLSAEGREYDRRLREEQAADDEEQSQ